METRPRQRTVAGWAGSGVAPTRRDYRVDMEQRALAGVQRPSIAGRLHKLVLSLALGLCAIAWLAPVGRGERTVSAHPSSVAPLGGLNIAPVNRGSSLANVDREISLARALHAKVVRVELPWSEFEPLAPNQTDPRTLAVADRLMSDAGAAGVGVIAMVEGTPCWASSAPASLLRACVPGRPSKAGAWPPSNPAPYAAFVASLAQRYGTRLAAIEIWNEPDQINQRYFAGPEKPKRYAAILRAAYPAIKQVDPRLPVLAGSLVGSNGIFLRDLYAAGIEGYYDGLSVHFYTLVLASLRAIHETQLANRDTKPLWLNEFGWSSCWPRHNSQQEQACVTAATQGANLADTFHALARAPYIAAEVVYAPQDSSTEDFGVLAANGARKPSFSALSSVFASPFGRSKPVTLSLSSASGWVVASGSGPVGDYMELEASEHGVLRYRALFILDRFNRYSIVLPRVLGTRGLRVRVYQYWAGPGKDAQKSI
jgi:polysaccharide biosynthesis protein PslG